MTETGYTFASWMHKHMNNILVGVSYGLLFIVLLFAVSIWLQPEEKEPEREVRVTQDNGHIQRR